MKTPKDNAKVKIRLVSGKTVQGDININGFDRISDYINNNNIDFIPVYNAVIDGKDKSKLLINKNYIEHFRIDKC